MGHAASDFERVGGPDGLHAIVHEMVGRFFDDLIIGFLFAGKDRARIERHEYELAAAHLGGDVIYRGRPLGEAHRPLRINRGQFRRRLLIVQKVLRDRGVPEEVVARWLEVEGRLEPVVTDGSDCVG